MLPDVQFFWYTGSSGKIRPELRVMAKVCQVTGKRPSTGNNVSH
ncbi:MAG: hypothetical protein COX66_12560, partial [Elusimicrobia bacterium CG_4_10_14_0_2_um_filter_63_34]